MVDSKNNSIIVKSKGEQEKPVKGKSGAKFNSDSDNHDQESAINNNNNNNNKVKGKKRNQMKIPTMNKFVS